MLQEVSAVGAGNDQIGPIQDAGLGGPSFVPFSLDHNGNCWCLVTGQAASDGEYPVAYVDPQTNGLVGEGAGREAEFRACRSARNSPSGGTTCNRGSGSARRCTFFPAADPTAAYPAKLTFAGLHT
jgi:hypothetical protein